MTKFLLAIIAVLVLFVGGALMQGDSYKQFMKTAARVNGHIIDKEERAPDAKTKEYWVTYSYTDGKGEDYTTQANIEYQDIWQGLRAGQVEPIYFNKKDPSESYLVVVIDRKLGKK